MYDPFCGGQTCDRRGELQGQTTLGRGQLLFVSFAYFLCCRLSIAGGVVFTLFSLLVSLVSLVFLF